jgi:hypothetical protein
MATGYGITLPAALDIHTLHTDGLLAAVAMLAQCLDLGGIGA